MAFWVVASNVPDSIKANSSLSSAFRISAAKMRGEMIPANLLHIPMILIRRAALSIGPIMVTYGLAAVCRIAKPVPMENKPIRKISNCRAKAAGTNMKAPNAVSMKPYIIPRLKPTLFNSTPEGTAITK